MGAVMVKGDYVPTAMEALTELEDFVLELRDSGNIMASSFIREECWSYVDSFVDDIRTWAAEIEGRRAEVKA